MEVLAIFTLASTLLSLAPGPDNLFVPLQSATYGAWPEAYLFSSHNQLF